MTSLATAQKFSSPVPTVPATNYDNLLIYRTNISSKKRVKLLQAFFDEHPQILDWNVDRDDVDNVLRIEIGEGIEEVEVISFILSCGLMCEELEY